MLLLACLGGVLTAVACTRVHSGAPIYSATVSAQYDEEGKVGLTRRQALQSAVREARNHILNKALELRLSNGQVLGDLAVVDPFVRAVLEDTVRAARITDRAYSEDGLVTVTVSMELEPLYKLIEEYPQHALQ